MGFVLFDVGPQERDMYELLQKLIGNALRGALLAQKVQEHAENLAQTNAELSRQKYILDTFMDTVPDAIFFKDLNSRFIRSNPAHSISLNSDNPAELCGKSDFDFFPKEQAQVRYVQEQEIIRSGQALLALEELGNFGKWAMTTKMPLRDEHGHTVGTFGISRDITALKNTELALKQEISERLRTEVLLRESEEQYRTLFERLQDLFFRVDPDGIVWLVSPSITQLTGYCPEDVVGTHIAKTLLASPGQWQELIARLKQDGKLHNFEILLKHHNGSTVWGSVTSQWLTDPAGTLLGVEGMIRNISERKQTQEALERAYSEILTTNDKLKEENQRYYRKSRLVSAPLQHSATGMDTNASDAWTKPFFCVLLFKLLSYSASKIASSGQELIDAILQLYRSYIHETHVSGTIGYCTPLEAALILNVDNDAHITGLCAFIESHSRELLNKHNFTLAISAAIFDSESD